MRGPAMIENTFYLPVVPDHFDESFRGYTADLSIVIVFRTNPDGKEVLGVLTPCCQAGATGIDTGIVCKHCYEYVPDDFADLLAPFEHLFTLQEIQTFGNVEPEPHTRVLMDDCDCYFCGPRNKK